MRDIVCFDLFAGGGGASEGLEMGAVDAGKTVRELVAVNHCKTAIATHRANHPNARHFCEDIRRVDPRKAMGGKSPDMGVCGVDCTDHSRAKGGRPLNLGLRSLGWDVLRWARLTEPKNILIENVPEFRDWGPLDDDGRPIKARRGEYFGQFTRGFEALGYTVEHRILCAAHYGDATTRRRLFIQARLGNRPVWPEPSHADPAELTASMTGAQAWRTAREIIDWNLPGKSIFDREKDIADSTKARIAEGIERYCGGPFLLGIGGPRGRQVVRSVDMPYRTVLTRSHDYLCQPFLIRYNDGGRVQDVDLPLTTIDTSNRFALIQAFLVSYYGNGRAHDLAEPLPTVTTRDRFALIEVWARMEHRLAEQGLAIADVRMRMLEPHEYAAAHSFPPDYQFMGNRAQKVAQIGHSWPIRTGRAICRQMLSTGGMA